MSDNLEVKTENSPLLNDTTTVVNSNNDSINEESAAQTIKGDNNDADVATQIKDKEDTIEVRIENDTNTKEQNKDVDIFNKAIESETNNETKLPSIANDDIDVGNISSSSSEDSSSDSSSDGDEDDKNDAEEDDIEEEGPVDSGPIRSKNEVLDETVIEIPEDYKLKPDEKIQLIGTIKSIYENNIIVAATMSGEQRVLKDGSIFCLENRDIIGTLNEVFGPLQNPFYRICFKKDKMGDMTPMIKEKIGENVYYAVPEAHWVDTFELKRNKGTDASNRFDEEISESEQEFSDDEKEAQYKKMKKDSKKKRNGKNTTTTTTNNNTTQNKRQRTNNNNNRNQNRVHNNNNNNQKFGDYPSMRLPVGMTAPNRSTSVATGYVSRNARSHTNNTQPPPNRHTSSIYDDDENVPTKTKVVQNSQNVSGNNYQGTITQQNPYYGQQSQSYTGAMNYPQQQQQPGNFYFQPPQNMNMNNMGYPMNFTQPFPPPPNNMYSNANPYFGYQQPPVQGNMSYPPQQNMNQVKQLHQLLMQQQQQQQPQSQQQSQQQGPYNDNRNYTNQKDQQPY